MLGVYVARGPAITQRVGSRHRQDGRPFERTVSDSTAAAGATPAGRFDDRTREFLLRQRGIGPGVIAQLECRGVHTMPALVQWTSRADREQWSPGLASRGNALRRAAALWLAQEQGLAA